MASAKRTPKVSRITRGPTVAYARKQKPAGGDDGDSDEVEDAAGKPGDPNAPTNELPTTTRDPSVDPSAVTTPLATPFVPPSSLAPPSSAVLKATDAAASKSTDAVASKTADAAAKAAASAVTAPLPTTGPWTESPAAKPADPARVRSETVAMPVQSSIGEPPAMPKAARTTVPPPMNALADEEPTRMPGPREIPEGSPDDPAQPPGLVPRGDSRSMRRRADRYEFALVYRMQTFVITRSGVVGTRGQWRVVEYPTSASASHAYAKESSRFVSEGFSDYRG